MTTKQRKLPLSTRILDLPLSIRASGRMTEWLGMDATLGDLIAHTEREVHDAPNVGLKTFHEVIQAVREAGHEFEQPIYECCNWCRHWNWHGGSDIAMGACTRVQRLATAATTCCPEFDPPQPTVAEVLRRIEEIRACAGDDEAAHGREDDLYHDFIRSLAPRHDRIGRLARLVLQTRLVTFTRHCA